MTQQQRCTLCGRIGHKRTEHVLNASAGYSGPPRKHAPEWYVVVRDVSGIIDGWIGPLFWNVGVAVARRIDALRDGRGGGTKLERYSGRLRGEPMPFPDGWRDYDPLRTDRAPRINVGVSRARRAA